MRGCQIVLSYLDSMLGVTFSMSERFEIGIYSMKLVAKSTRACINRHFPMNLGNEPFVSMDTICMSL